MLEIFAYAIGVMYTPGPINLLGLHSGIQGKLRLHVGFFAGVAAAMLILFIGLSFLGNHLINQLLLPYISLVGCAYILYIAWKVFGSNIEVSSSTTNCNVLSFRDGFVMQLLNPKALVATLPISTIQFPAAGITGGGVIAWSLVLTVLAFGAPGSYSAVGTMVGKRIENPVYFKIFNILMSALLVFVAISIGYEHAYLPLNPSLPR